MSDLFLRLLNISITAGWIVLVAVLLRFVLKKVPKWIRLVLWGLVALRLLLPFSITSILSLVPSGQTVVVEQADIPSSVSGQTSVDMPYALTEQGERIVIQSGFTTMNSAVNPPLAQAAKENDHILAVVKAAAGWVWLGGAVIMLLYGLVSFLRLRHKIRASVKLEKGVYVCDEIRDPFILGVFVPRIYLPSGMDEQTRAHVLAHERAHLKRFDHIWKPLGFLLLAVYWFNPLLWLAYILLCRDIELACDEKVVKELDDTGKAAYSEALVSVSISRRSITVCPLAFGEIGVKTRVKSVLNYKKPAFWIILVAILACVVVAVCFLTVPKKKAPDPNADAANVSDSVPSVKDTEGSLHKTIPVGEVPAEFKEIVEQNLLYRAVTGHDRMLTYTTTAADTARHGISLYTLRDRYGKPLVEVSVRLDSLWPGCTAITSDGGFILTFTAKNDGFPNHEEAAAGSEGAVSYVLKYDATGNLRWKTLLPNFAGSLKYCIEKDGTYCFFGNLTEPTNQALTDLYLLKIGADGSVLKEQTYGGSGPDTILDVKTDESGFVLEASIPSADGDFAASGKWRMRVDSDLAIVQKELIPDSSAPNYIFDGLSFSDDPRAKNYPDGYVFAILDYDTFDLFVSENATGVYDGTPDLNGLSYSWETVYAAYDKQGNLLWKAAVDSVPNPDEIRIAEAQSGTQAQIWFDCYLSNYDETIWDHAKEIVLNEFPNVTFRWTGGSVEAVESGKTRTLFTGMPIHNVYFADVTNDGKPELCATISFGSGMIDEHIVVYDYVNKQSYTLWDRGTFDYHLYTVDGALYVGKTPYKGDKQTDYGTLGMHDGVLSCRWQSDGSYTQLYRELHESELIGEWLVEEEKDKDGNVLYTSSLDLWKEYHFKEDGTVVYNETVPVSSDSEKAFGHPVSYPYETHGDHVFIGGNTSGIFIGEQGDTPSFALLDGQYDREADRLMLSYSTPDGTVYATLKRMGVESPQTVEDMIIGTYTCTRATAGGRDVPIPAEYVGMSIDLDDSYDLPDVTYYRHVASIMFGGEEKAGYDWLVDADDVLTVWNNETGDTWTLQWLERDNTLLLTLDRTDNSGNPIVLLFPWSWME